MEQYPFSRIEKKWAARWVRERTYEPDLKRAKKPFYNLMMFPYPSAEGLHVGNVYAFSGSDVYGRFMRMRGHDVFEPIGLDGFGIHSENYAIKIGAHPMKLALRTEKNFYRQLKTIGNGFAWSARLETYAPEYYRFTQWIAVQLFKHGLMYRKKAPVNWCPSCKTVLADEQVIAGACERCESLVEKRDLEQWFLRITKYAERLLKNLKTLDWPEKILLTQKNWIGKSEGALIRFSLVVGPVVGVEPARGRKARVSGEAGRARAHEHSLEVFTTRPDTIWGVTYLVLAPEHPLLAELLAHAANREEVVAYRARARVISEADRLSEAREKTGVRLEGVLAVNPVNNEKVSVWVADYILGHYGTGAVMGVPAHDERDLAFAEKFRLPVKHAPLVAADRAIRAAKGRKVTRYRLRDWLISRQRYWGPPIPLVHCAACAEAQRLGKAKLSGLSAGELEHPGWIPVPEKQLPVRLPYLKNFRPTGSGEAPLASDSAFYSTKCPRCGKPARRETDVSDTFLDSAWYFLRYPSLAFTKGPFDPALIKKWLPVDRYIGGAEHAVLHLLYSRFVTMALKDLKFIPFEEPFRSLRSHGLIIRGGKKMSKSRGNVVNPDEYIRNVGADALRLHLMFMGPLEQGGDFGEGGVAGIVRFLNRAWKTGEALVAREKAVRRSQSRGRGRAPRSPGETERAKSLPPEFHQSIKKITEGFASLRYNTVIAELMVVLRRFGERESSLAREEFEAFLKLLAPLAPFITEELWRRLGNEASIHLAAWPKFNPRLARQETIELVIQVNGKLRDRVQVSREIGEAEAKELALGSERVKVFLAGRRAKKVIFVPGRLVNVVTS